MAHAAADEIQMPWPAAMRPPKFVFDDTNNAFLNTSHVRALERTAYDPTRAARVNATLAAASGVYRDKDKGRRLGLSRSVFVTVLAAGNRRRQQAHYKVYLRNLCCFLHHYGIDLVVYVVHHGVPDVAAEMRDVEEGLGVRTLTYPDALFWSVVAEKTTSFRRNRRGNTFAMYVDDEPSFSSYGTLIAMVPLLEVVEAGYTVLFCDLDVGLVQDPVPHMTRGDADLIVSVEQRWCPVHYPSTLVARIEAGQWQTIEPNIGVMTVRATPQGVAYYRNWLHVAVQTNVLNAQLVMVRDARLNQTRNPHDDEQQQHKRLMVHGTTFTSTHTSSCRQWGTPGSPPPSPTRRIAPHAATYCFMSEMLFQNGLSFKCNADHRPTRDDWYLEMVRQVPLVQVGGAGGPWLRLPVAVHANYCNEKTTELKVRGLWLLDEERLKHVTEAGARAGAGVGRKLGFGATAACKAYNMSAVYLAGKNWTAEVEGIEQYRRDLLRALLKNGTLVRTYAAAPVYILAPHPNATADARGPDAPSPLVRRMFPDGGTPRRHPNPCFARPRAPFDVACARVAHRYLCGHGLRLEADPGTLSRVPRVVVLCHRRRLFDIRVFTTVARRCHTQSSCPYRWDRTSRRCSQQTTRRTTATSQREYNNLLSTIYFSGDKGGRAGLMCIIRDSSFVFGTRYIVSGSSLCRAWVECGHITTTMGTTRRFSNVDCSSYSARVGSLSVDWGKAT